MEVATTKCQQNAVNDTSETVLNNPLTAENSSNKTSICHVIKNITIEPTIVLNVLATAMQDIIIQDLIRQQSCLSTYEKSEEFCDNVTDEKFRKQLSTEVANNNLYRTILETAPSAILVLFLGAWIDKYGPKLLVIVPLIGDMLACAAYSALAYMKYSNPYYLLLVSVLQGLTGGNLAFNLGACCYIIKESSLLTRTTRIALTDVAFFIGFPIGRKLGTLHEKIGYGAIFGLAFLFNLVALLYVLWRLRGVRYFDNQDTSKAKSFQDMFQCKNLRNSFAVLIKKREEHKRLHIFLIMICAQLITFPRKGERNIFYQFAVIRHGFTVNRFSNYEVIQHLNILIGNLIILPLFSYFFLIKDMTLAIVSVIASVINDLLIAFSESALMLYIAIIFLFFNTSASIISRSLLTKCVNQDEIGQLLAVFAVFASVSPSLSGLLYTQVYNATIGTFPGLCFVMSAALTLIPALCLGWVFYDLRKSTRAQSQVQSETPVIKLIILKSDNRQQMDKTDCQ